jgi:uncharacterized membrane protein
MDSVGPSAAANILHVIGAPHKIMASVEIRRPRYARGEILEDRRRILAENRN